MTTLCLADFHVSDEDRERIHVGNLAFNRAISLGYGKYTARRFQTLAKRDHILGTDPRMTALRIVPPKQHSATVRRPEPLGVA